MSSDCVYLSVGISNHYRPHPKDREINVFTFFKEWGVLPPSPSHITSTGPMSFPREGYPGSGPRWGIPLSQVPGGGYSSHRWRIPQCTPWPGQDGVPPVQKKGGLPPCQNRIGYPHHGQGGVPPRISYACRGRCTSCGFLQEDCLVLK